MTQEKEFRKNSKLDKIRRIFGFEKVDDIDPEEERKKYFSSRISEEKFVDGVICVKLDIREIKTDLCWVKRIMWAVFIYLFLQRVGVI